MAQAPNKYSVEALALAFFYALDAELSNAELREVCERNANEQNPNVCHTHDFCDANEVMATAWNDCGFPALDQSDEQLALWNAAWDECKSDYLQPQDGFTYGPLDGQA